MSKKPSYADAVKRYVPKNHVHVRYVSRSVRKTVRLSKSSEKFFNSNFEGIFVNIMGFCNVKMLKSFIFLNRNVNNIFNRFFLYSLDRQRVVLLNNETHNIRNVSQNVLEQINLNHNREVSKTLINSKNEFINNLSHFLRNEKVMKDVVDVILDHGNFVIGGSSILYGTLKPDHLTLTEDFGDISDKEKLAIKRELLNSVYEESDVDVFLISKENNRNSQFISLLRKIKSKLRYQHVITCYNDIFNIIPQDTKRYRTIQIILKKLRTVDELLLFADLDCTRLAFDGKTIIGTRESVNALITKKNNLPIYSDRRLFLPRINKYAKRGFETVYRKINPLCHEKFEPCKDDLEIVPGEMYKKIDIKYDNAIDLMKENGCRDSNKFVRKFSHTIDGIEVALYESIDEYLSVDYSDRFVQTYPLSAFQIIRRFLIRNCYICGKYTQYTSLKKCLNSPFCSKCERFNRNKRKLKRNLTGKIAIVTGGRIKIGKEIVLKLLRSNCTVVATTRFVKDAKRRYLKESDYYKWKNRLLLYPLDMKNGDHVIAFTKLIEQHFHRVDILINNAAVTIRHPIQYYEGRIKNELGLNNQKRYEKKMGYRKKEHREWDMNLGMDFKRFSENFYRMNKKVKNVKIRFKKSKKNNDYSGDIKIFSLAPYFNTNNQLRIYANLVQKTIQSVMSNLIEEDNMTKGNYSLFPKNQYDEYDEPIDNRKKNSWNKKIDEITSTEVLEVNAVNNIAPTILVSKLFPLMISNGKKRKPSPSYIINITSDEGYFDEQRQKNSNHTHNNISKAALNQLTRSSAHYFSTKGILMNSVDVGWVSSSRVVNLMFKPPLSLEDAMARALAPIFSNSRMYGKLYRNFIAVNW